MARPNQHPQLALDTNILFDLVAGKDFALTVLEVLEEEQAVVRVTPTVLIELQHEVEAGKPQKAAAAESAFDLLIKHGIKPVELTPAEHGIAVEFSQALQAAEMLPDGELHDGTILAEASQAGLDYLLTSDRDLLGINRDDLERFFEKRDLHLVQVVSPRTLFAMLKRR